MTHAALIEMGWSTRWQALFESCVDADLTPARVVRSDRGSSLVAGAAGVFRAKSSVRLVKAAHGPGDLPVVGDWVGVRMAVDLDTSLIEVVLGRKSAIVRGDPGQKSEAQVLAANIDTVFVVHPIAESPNLRRIERELSLAWDSGATPVVVLTKADLSAAPDSARADVETISIGVDVILVNALDGESAAQLLGYVSDHRTGALIGPSGAGKSTLINGLVGEQRVATQDVRAADGRGRHTTVARELITMPGHGVIIDTPGLRAVGLTGSEDGIASTFPDIEELAVSCRFRDCGHGDEPGCAVRSAVEAGTLSADRLVSYHKLVREARVAASRSDARIRAEEHRKAKQLSKTIRRYYKQKGGR